MGIMAVTIKIMPESPETDLEKIKETIKKSLEENEGKNAEFEEEPVAFGLKAVIVKFWWPEDKEFEEFENSLKEIEGVSSTETIDLRRAVG